MPSDPATRSAPAPAEGTTGPLDRRSFLGQTGIITGWLAAGSPFALIAPSRAWAVDLRVLKSAEGAALMAMARTIAPHDQLEDAAYALVVRAIDDAAVQDAALRTRLTQGLSGLGDSFAHSPEDRRVAALKAVESTAFFQSVRSFTLRVLYSSPMAYTAFGYEGEAFSKGGYLLRGFNELRWLPEVPLADSGSVSPAGA
jgi:hypothetical protein